MQGGSTLNCLWLWKYGTDSESKLKHCLDSLAVPPIKHHTLSSAIANIRATGHYLVPSARQYCTYIQPISTGPSVQVANGANIEPSTRATILLSTKLSQEAHVGHIFDDLKSGSLVSIEQLCDDYCVAIFTKYHVDIVKNRKSLLEDNAIPPTAYVTLLSHPNPDSYHPPNLRQLKNPNITLPTDPSGMQRQEAN